MICHVSQGNAIVVIGVSCRQLWRASGLAILAGISGLWLPQRRQLIIRASRPMSGR
jgi:hypothetical protein